MAMLGIIPARGGSKGFPRKNLALLNGKPLIAYSCEAALSSQRLDSVYVSTDDEEIAETCRTHGIDKIIDRPQHLAADDASMEDVLGHALETVSASVGDVTGIVLLQPTSPLRRAQHIDAAVDLFETSGADTVVTIVPVPHQFNPVSVLREDQGVLHPFIDSKRQILRRQDKPQVFARNGPAVLVATPDIIRSGYFYGGRTIGLPMTPGDSVDIDAESDMALAAWLLSQCDGSDAE